MFLLTKWDREKSVFIGVNELTGRDFPTENFHLDAPLHRTGKRVADACPPRDRLESGVGHLVDVANRPIDDRPDAAECAVNITVHLSPKRTDGARFVEILHDDDLRSREACHVTAIFRPATWI